VQFTPTQEDEAMHTITELVDELYKVTGGRGKWWQAGKRAIKLTFAIHTATGARKIALQRQLDALVRNHSA
jgi:hypothetical protein